MPDRISADQSEMIAELLAELSGLGLSRRAVFRANARFRWGCTADRTADRGQGLAERNQLLQRWQGNLRDPFDARLTGPMPSKGMWAGYLEATGGWPWSLDDRRPLTFHEHQPRLRQR